MDTRKKLIRLVEWAVQCSGDSDTAVYARSILLGAVLLEGHTATHRDGMGSLAKHIGPQAFKQLKTALAANAAVEDYTFKCDPRVFLKPLPVNLSFLGIEDPNWLRHDYVRYINGFWVHYS